MNDKISTSAGQLEQMFRVLNQQAFNGLLEEPIITIQSTPGAHGHVTTAKVWKREDGERFELNISAETMARPIVEVAATMMHEMAHLENMKQGIQDTSRGGAYHNKRFKTTAEATGLVTIGHNEKYGWTITVPTQKLAELCQAMQWQNIAIKRETKSQEQANKGAGGDKNGERAEVEELPSEKKRSHSRRYECPKCGLIVRATKDCTVICGKCFETMLLT